MRLYVSTDGVWTGTQADAKAHAKDTGLRWTEVEVPTDKAGLMGFLNDHSVGRIEAVKQPPAPVVDVIPVEKPAQVMVKSPPPVVSRLDIEEAILQQPLHVSLQLAELVYSRLAELAR